MRRIPLAVTPGLYETLVALAADTNTTVNALIEERLRADPAMIAARKLHKIQWTERKSRGKPKKISSDV